MIIDSHQHFWIYEPVKDAWITNDMRLLQRNFLPEDLLPILNKNGVEGCVAVQADQREEETNFLVSLAEKHSFIKGVVGWTDLRSPLIKQKLEQYSGTVKLKGFRHIVQAEPGGFMLDENFLYGIESLKYFDFTYDILIFPPQLPEAVTLVSKFPDQKFVIDHLAKPNFKEKDFTNWVNNISKFKEFENVSCKLSGLVTEADWKNWGKEDFQFCLGVALETFGSRRLLFGSDWPVCLLAAGYRDVLLIVKDFIASLSLSEQENILYNNAINFYNLQ